MSESSMVRVYVMTSMLLCIANNVYTQNFNDSALYKSKQFITFVVLCVHERGYIKRYIPSFVQINRQWSRYNHLLHLLGWVKEKPNLYQAKI